MLFMKLNRDRTHNRESGATATEYIIILVLVAIASLALWKKFGGEIASWLKGGTETMEKTRIEAAEGKNVGQY